MKYFAIGLWHVANMKVTKLLFGVINGQFKKMDYIKKNKYNFPITGNNMEHLLPQVVRDDCLVKTIIILILTDLVRKQNRPIK